MSDSKVQLLLLQPTPYLRNRSSEDRMTGATLTQLFADLVSSPRLGQRLNILWSGGEPLLLPIKYYQEALAIIEKNALPTMTIGHCIQTNGILIDDDWCEFFKMADIKIGVSIDGPPDIHDASGLRRQGAPTFAKTMAGIRYLQRHGIDFAVTSRLGAASLDKPRELHDFYVTEGLDKVFFNIEEIEGLHLGSQQSLEQEARFRNFIREFRNLIVGSKSPLHVHEFDEMLRAIVDPPAGGIRNILVEPLAVLCVDWRGRFSTFSLELPGQTEPSCGDFVIGDVEAGLDAALGSERFSQLSAEVGKGVEHCRGSCEYFSLCGGGSPVTKLYENGSIASAETMSCRLRVKAVADLLLETVERSVAKEQQKQVMPVHLQSEEIDLYIVGTGIALPQHLTVETLDVLRTCSLVCTNLTDRQLANLPEDIRSKCQSVWALYRADRRRWQNYTDVQATVVAAVEREKGPVAWLTQGHPRIFDSVSENLVDQGRERGWKVRVLPAISSIDTLLVEVDYDPGHGLLVHEASALIRQNIVPSPAIGMLLLQPGLFLSDLPHLSRSDPEPDLVPLRDYLLRFYEEGHRCAFARSPTEPRKAPEITWVRLADLCSVPYERVAGSTLFVSRRLPDPA